MYVPVEEVQKQESFFQAEPETTTHKTFQIQKKYLLSSIKSGVVLIHQSLAHQRILYEELLEKVKMQEVHSQQLLFPITISFSSSEIETIYSLKSDLESIGFMFDAVSYTHPSPRDLSTSRMPSSA